MISFPTLGQAASGKPGHGRYDVRKGKSTAPLWIRSDSLRQERGQGPRGKAQRSDTSEAIGNTGKWIRATVERPTSPEETAGAAKLGQTG